MAECVRTPNILWKVKNFASIHKQSGPTIKFMGLKFHVSVSRYMEAGIAKLQLILDRGDSQPSPPWDFNIDACLVLLNNGVRYMIRNGRYNLMHKEWRVWTDSVSTIQQTLGQIRNIIFLIIITPTGNLEALINEKSVEETKQKIPCTVSFREDIGNLFNNTDLSDFTLTCGDRKYFVHKAILSARSRFFEGMFRHDMKEVNEKEGKIEKMEPDILEVVLRYLYTGELPSLPMDSIKKICVAADRFIIEPLKIECLSLLLDGITTESEKDPEKVTEDEQPNLDEQSTMVKKEVDDSKENQMLKNLFMSREWRLFSEEFPHKAFEMCKPYFLQEL